LQGNGWDAGSSGQRLVRHGGRREGERRIWDPRIWCTTDIRVKIEYIVDMEAVCEWSCWHFLEMDRFGPCSTVSRKTLVTRTVWCRGESKRGTWFQIVLCFGRRTLSNWYEITSCIKNILKGMAFILSCKAFRHLRLQNRLQLQWRGAQNTFWGIGEMEREEVEEWGARKYIKWFIILNVSTFTFLIRSVPRTWRNALRIFNKQQDKVIYEYLFEPIMLEYFYFLATSHFKK
jgi:hypothetical protein